MAKITVLIPTYNRGKCIEKFIKESLAPYQGHLFCFEIHDSSSTDDTFNLVNGFLNTHPASNLFYKRYPSSLNGDIKTLNAIQNVKTDFLYLMGDGLLVNFNKLETILLVSDFQSYDVIDLNNLIFPHSKGTPTNQMKSYSNLHAFANDYFKFITLYGASIISLKVFNLAYQNGTVQKYIDAKSSFMYICSLFTALSMIETNFHGGSIWFDGITSNPYKEGSTSVVSKTVIDVFCKQYSDSIDMLPSYYDSQKSYLKMSIGKALVFSTGNLLIYREKGNITFRIIRKYQSYIKQTVYSPWRLKIVALIPKGLIKFARNVHHCFKKKA